VTNTAEISSPAGGNRFLQDFVLSRHGRLHRLRIPLPQPGGSFKVGEEEGHRARWWMPGHVSKRCAQCGLVARVLAKPRNKSALGEPLRAAAAIEADYVSIPPLPAGNHNLYVTDDVST
jgi:hypothetical protein